MPRTPKRSRDDEIGQLLVDAGQFLVRTGTPIEQVTLAAAAELASHQKKKTISVGRAYPRFRDQNDFRLAVLEAFLDDEPSYSDLALHGISQAIQEMGDGRGEILEPEDVPTLIAKVAAEHEEEIRRDKELGLRLYAIWRLKTDAGERSQEHLAKLRKRDELINEEWTKTTGILAAELGAAPLSDLQASDFEIALTALRDGLLVRQLTTEIPEGILGRLVGALILGFFAEKREAETETLRQRLIDVFGSPAMRRHQRKVRLSVATIQNLAADSVRNLSPISDEELDAASPPVRRALEILRQRGRRL